MFLTKFRYKENKSNYNICVKAKLDLHLLVVKIKWDISNKEHVTEHDQFLHEHEKAILPNSQASIPRYSYIEYLAFVAIYICDKEICDIAGYLNYSELCLTSRPQKDLPYRLLLFVKNSVENLLNFNVHTSDILAQNAKIVKNVFGNHIIIGNNRTLLTAMNIANIRKQIIKKNWDINIQTDATKNLK
ncbi:16247_t:CDS:2 [Gigaspora margarita]|uniref:16247_t:CDS:1 n=1 Tax=Gigaspora margarita TaxID=4874 RepID=A0ABN7VHZ6_GIGMA|nr:16247_t:CDS:2 [Gigaspora margarita]